MMETASFVCRTIASLRVFDTFGRVTYVNACDNNALGNYGLLWLDSAAVMTNMHAIVGRKSWTGFAAYRILASRILFLWPVLPFLYVWPIAPIANRIYRHVADSRTCSIAAPAPLVDVQEKSGKSWIGAPAAAVVGTFILVMNILCASQGATKSWPFAAYPTFARMTQPLRSTIGIVARNQGGEDIPVQMRNVKQTFAPHRYESLIGHILRTDDPAQRRERFAALWSLAMRESTNLSNISSVRFYRLTLSTIPERWRENPLEQVLLFELKLVHKTVYTDATSARRDQDFLPHRKPR